jgi:hypothetical protein
MIKMVSNSDAKSGKFLEDTLLILDIVLTHPPAKISPVNGSSLSLFSRILSRTKSLTYNSHTTQIVSFN